MYLTKPTRTQVSDAVQTLLAAGGFDPLNKGSRVISVSIDQDGELIVRTYVEGINRVPLMNADGKSLKIAEFATQLGRGYLMFQYPNPYLKEKKE